MRCRKKVLLTVLLTFILPVLFLTGCKQQEEKPFIQYTDFREIPGVTPEEIDAIERILAERDHLNYGAIYSPEAFRFEGETKISGFTGLFCEYLEELFGIPFEITTGTFNEVMTGMENGDFDFTGDLCLTKERLQDFHMTSAIVERKMSIFSVLGMAELEKEALNRPLHFLFIRGTVISSIVEDTISHDYVATYVENAYEAIPMILSGEADAIILEDIAKTKFTDYPQFKIETYLPLTYSPVSLATKNDELEPFISVIQKYLDSDSGVYLASLHRQGQMDFKKHQLNQLLTQEEREYIKEMQEEAIPVIMSADDYPMVFYNEYEEEFQGAGAQLLKDISGLTGLSFRTVNGTDVQWTKLLSLLEEGEAAICMDLNYSHDRANRFLWADEPYATDRYCLISLFDTPNINTNDIRHHKVGLVAGTAYEEVFNEWFPNHAYSFTYDSAEAAFNALENGEVDMLMLTQHFLLYATHYLEISDLKVNYYFDRNCTFYIGFHKDEVLLRSIVSKAQSLIDTDIIYTSWINRVFDYQEKMLVERSRIYIICCVFLLILFFFLLAVLRQNRKINKNLENIVDERTRELLFQTKQAEAASLSKSDFLARMSHEIRTPLNAIVGMAQIMKKDHPGDSLQKEPVEELLSASKHLSGVLNDVLDMSKIEAGKFHLNYDAFSITDVIKEVKSIIRFKCEEKQLALQIQSDTVPDTMVMGDKLRLKQILVNLLGNAVKFTESGGNIALSVERKEESLEEIRLEFCVTDNGIGMSEEQVNRLFLPFEQADKTIAVRYGGTGLGLSISQFFVEKMGGRIQVESKEKEGSRFHFAIGFPIAGSVTEPVPQAPVTLNLSGKNILIAEDVEINRSILIDLLRDSDARFFEAENGLQAVTMFRDSPHYFYDLIFMDIIMPEMDGYEATRQIRHLMRPDAPEVKIVALTANAYQEDVEKALAHGMDAHVGKPIDIEQIRRLLLELLHV